MKLARLLVLLVLAGAMCAAAMGDPIDPRGSLIGGGNSTGLFSLNDPNFAFTVFGGFSPQQFDFINASGQLVGEVDLLVTLLAGTPALTFTVDPENPYFTSATVTSLGNGQTLYRFFGLDETHGGLPFATDLPNSENCDGIQNCYTETPGADFGVVFANNTGTLDLTNLPSNQGFGVVGTLVATPEPSSIVLLLAGSLVFLVAFLKRA